MNFKEYISEEASDDKFRNLVDEIGEDMDMSSQEIIEYINLSTKFIAATQGWSMKQIKDSFYRMSKHEIEKVLTTTKNRKSEAEKVVAKWESDKSTDRLIKQLNSFARFLSTGKW